MNELMSRPSITVDYFSHTWDALDLACAWSELRQQAATLRNKLLHLNDDIETGFERTRQTNPSLLKANRRLLAEEYRLHRLRNALWRRMSSHCTSRLGRHNPRIDPGEINWEKDSDVSWLYGPLFRRDEGDVDFEKRIGCPEIFIKGTQTSLTKIEAMPAPLVKSALKKTQKERRRSFPLSLERDGCFEDRCKRPRGIRFEADVLEFVYHAKLPILSQRRPTRTPQGDSDARRMAKALLLAARKHSTSLPLTPPLSPSVKFPAQPILAENALASTLAPVLPASVPTLCADLVSLSTEMVALAGTAAIYKGISYGLGRFIPRA
ncbi:hypothetical protein CLU79DRAFT_519725 [Phycomyces nitens]|nr:hypothetical protein CLU79DRAFT_519725 [Phycomyces nitens]